MLIPSVGNTCPEAFLLESGKTSWGSAVQVCALWSWRAMAYGLRAHIHSVWRQQISFLLATIRIGSTLPLACLLGELHPS